MAPRRYVGAPFLAIGIAFLARGVAGNRAFIATSGRSSSLVEAGFTPVEAIAIATRNGAVCLGREARIGTIGFGKEADLVVINGDPSRAIGDIRNVETVFEHGVGFDPAKLIDSVRERVGLW